MNTVNITTSRKHLWGLLLLTNPPACECPSRYAHCPFWGVLCVQKRLAFSDWIPISAGLLFWGPGTCLNRNLPLSEGCESFPILYCYLAASPESLCPGIPVLVLRIGWHEDICPYMAIVWIKFDILWMYSVPIDLGLPSPNSLESRLTCPLFGNCVPWSLCV